MTRKSIGGDWSKVLDPVQTPVSLADQVYKNLVEAILKQQIKPGQHLVEQPLADQLGVSRISIREAIRHLEQDGLVKVVPTRGAFVVELSAADVEEVYRLRTALETIAVEHILTYVSPSMLAVFDPILEEMAIIENEEDYLRSAEIDNLFHRTLMELSGLQRTKQIWEQLSSQIMMVIYTVSRHYPSIRGLSTRHRQLLEAISTKDVKAATNFLQSHIAAGAKNTLMAMRQE